MFLGDEMLEYVAIIIFDGRPIGTVENLKIIEKINDSPLFIDGEVANFDLWNDIQGKSIIVSGKLMISTGVILLSESDKTHYMGLSYNIDIMMVDNKADPPENLTEPIITALNCNMVNNVDKMFTADGIFVVRNFMIFDELKKLHNI